MPVFGMHDPGLQRHHIAMLLALVRRSGTEIILDYEELLACTEDDQLEIINDLARRQIRLSLRQSAGPVALPAPNAPALEQ
jgi:hypothetical protein